MLKTVPKKTDRKQNSLSICQTNRVLPASPSVNDGTKPSRQGQIFTINSTNL